MATEIKVPALGESVTTATIARWIKQPGETVAADEPLVELETDKVTVEVSAPAAGVLTAINFPEGSEVEVGALLGMLDGDAAARRAEARAGGRAPNAGRQRRRTAGPAAAARAAPGGQSAGRDQSAAAAVGPGVRGPAGVRTPAA